MKKVLLLLLCVPLIGLGQVYIPDANFKAYLVGNTAININGDTEIQLSEAATYNGSIWCGNMNISDLTGIEDFAALTFLSCSENQLTSLDVSQNTALIDLTCASNNLTSLDISNNIALTSLYCDNNQLTSLDVSANTALGSLLCYDNQLTSLDVSANTALITLHCDMNQLNSLNLSGASNLEWVACRNNHLTSLDGSTNTALNRLDVGNNQLIALDIRNGNNTNIPSAFWNGFISTGNNNLTCINVDNDAWSTANWTNIDPQHYFSTNCPPPSAIQEHTTNKKILKVTDILGREVNEKRNTPLFYIYNDGTVEKKIILE